jgi:type II secretory pathway component PulC
VTARWPLVLSAVLVVVSVAYAIDQLRRETATVSSLSTASRARELSAVPAATTRALSHETANYSVVINRNLFSPTRKEVVASGVEPSPMMPALHGVVYRDKSSVAYLEDPSTKRVAGYHTGDSVAGNIIRSIAEDHVVLARPEGLVTVRLHDSARSRRPDGTASSVVHQPSVSDASGPQPGFSRPVDGRGKRDE